MVDKVGQRQGGGVAIPCVLFELPADKSDAPIPSMFSAQLASIRHGGQD